MAVIVRPGDVIQIAEADYCYGYGDLTFRVTAVDPDVARYSTLEWIGVLGVEIYWNGDSSDEREVLVRVSALKRVPPRKRRIDADSTKGIDHD